MRRWQPIIEEAADIVNGYSYLITLRQLHYLLVAQGVGGYTNDDTCYKRLSSLTAEARREGTFPDLLDQTRQIYQQRSWPSPQEAMKWLAEVYRRDRTEDQDWMIVLGGEKATLLAQLNQWYGALGMPIVLLRGYSSQTYVDDVAERVTDDGRKAVLIYAGDFDASGEDIRRDFLSRCDVFDQVEHIAVQSGQIGSLSLIVNKGKAKDSRAEAFIERYAALHQQHNFGRDIEGRRIPVQIEVEAIQPDDLRDLYTTAITSYWDESAFSASVEQETAEREQIERRAKRWK